MDGGESRIEPVLARLASSQGGVVSRPQLLDAGVSRHAIAHRVAVGWLHPVHRGVYMVGHTAPAAYAAEWAALLACGLGGALSHGTAAWVWALLPRPEGPVHVTIAAPHRDGVAGVRLHRADELDVVHRDGLPVTSVARTLADLAAYAPDRELERAVTEARLRRLVTDRILLDAGAGRRGARRLRALTEDEPALTRSEAERQLLALVARAGLPAPRANARVGRFEADLLWPQGRLIVEVDGYAFHGGREAFERDRARDAELLAAGYRVLRVTWRQLTERPEAVVARLAQALAAPA